MDIPLMNTRARYLVSVLLLGTVAIFVLFLSYPRLASSLSYIPVDAALKRHWQDYPIKKSQFPVLTDIAKRAIQTLGLARYWRGLGWLYYLQANTYELDTSERQSLLSQSQNAFETSLKKSPAEPATWLRLAWVHAMLEHDTEVVNTLNMSFYTGRAERYLILNRLNLALRYVQNYPEEDLPLIRDQIQLAWRFFPADMLKFLRSGALDQTVLFALIEQDSPQLLKEIQDTL